MPDLFYLPNTLILWYLSNFDKEPTPIMKLLNLFNTIGHKPDYDQKKFVQIISAMNKDDFNVFMTYIYKLEHHVKTINGSWATDLPERFKDHPAHELLFEIKFPTN